MMMKLKTYKFSFGLFKSSFKSFTKLQRKNFKIIDEHDIDYFKSIIPKDDVITNESDLIFFNTDWLKKYVGNAPAVLRPKTTEQISKILKYCNQKKIAVVPQGGNTGLVGGSVPVFDEVILNLSKMNKIIVQQSLHINARVR